MKIGIITPAPPRSHYGNRVTALRWARILRRLGHRVSIAQEFRGEPYDLLIALHARRSYPAVRRFHREYAERPVVVALTGTDLYRDLPRSRVARKSLEMASRIVALQPKARERLSSRLRRKARVIYQSVKNGAQAARRGERGKTLRRGRFDVCVIGHLRGVKDPFRAAFAARILPTSSRIRILHAGGAMNPLMAARARKEMKVNRRYHWLGEQSPERVRKTLLQSRLCVLSSKMEGGANVLSEAIVAGVPVLASCIPGSVGILGPRYPGYFPVGNTRALARLLARVERDTAFLHELAAHCKKLAPRFSPKREQAAWARLVKEIFGQ